MNCVHAVYIELTHFMSSKCVCPLLQKVCEDCSKGLPGVPGMAGTKGEKGDEGKTGIGNASDGCERVRGWG